MVCVCVVGMARITAQVLCAGLEIHLVRVSAGLGSLSNLRKVLLITEPFGLHGSLPGCDAIALTKYWLKFTRKFII